MAIRRLDITEGSVCETILLSLDKSPKRNKKLCINVFNEVNQNNRSRINSSLKRMQQLFYVKNTEGLWSLDQLNGDYIVKIIKNLRKK